MNWKAMPCTLRISSLQMFNFTTAKSQTNVKKKANVFVIKYIVNCYGRYTRINIVRTLNAGSMKGTEWDTEPSVIRHNSQPIKILFWPQSKQVITNFLILTCHAIPCQNSSQWLFLYLETWMELPELLGKNIVNNKIKSYMYIQPFM